MDRRPGFRIDEHVFGIKNSEFGDFSPLRDLVTYRENLILLRGL